MSHVTDSLTHYSDHETADGLLIPLMDYMLVYILSIHCASPVCKYMPFGNQGTPR